MSVQSAQLVSLEWVTPEQSSVAPSFSPGVKYQLPSGVRVHIVACTREGNEEMVTFRVPSQRDDFVIQLSVQNFRDTLKPKPV